MAKMRNPSDATQTSEEVLADAVPSREERRAALAVKAFRRNRLALEEAKNNPAEETTSETLFHLVVYGFGLLLVISLAILVNEWIGSAGFLFLLFHFGSWLMSTENLEDEEVQ